MKSLDELEFKSTLNEPEDEMPAVLVINSGAGGTESQDWAEMLMRMYRMYGEKQGWKVSEVDVQYGDGAGIKQATLEFDGEFAYGLSQRPKAAYTAWCASLLSILTPAGTLLLHPYLCTRS
jgi:peptide chain release factor 2